MMPKAATAKVRMAAAEVRRYAIMLMVFVAMTLILEDQKYLKMTMLTTKMVTMMITQTAEEPGAVLDQDLVGRLRAAIRSQLSVGLLLYFANSDIWWTYNNLF